MKKLKLKMYLSGAELLNREQMKQIMGGFIWCDGSGSGSASGSGGGLGSSGFPVTEPDPPACLGTECSATTGCGDGCDCVDLSSPTDKYYSCMESN